MFREWWKTLPETKEKIAQIARICETQDRRARTLRSSFRTWCFEKMGGEIWLQIFLAWKTVSPLAVDKVNVHIQNKIRNKAKKDALAASRGPLLSRRGAAKAANRPVPPKRGVQHKRQSSYWLRKHARWWSKRLNAADEELKAGRMSRRWYRTLEKNWEAIGSGWRRPKDFPELRRVLTQVLISYGGPYIIFL